MILSNLLVLLAERNLKISTVSKATKISRTTLTYLAYNTSKGIQFDTLNTLCRYLNVEPQQLILYSPVEIHALSLGLDSDNIRKCTLDLLVMLDNEKEEFDCILNGIIDLNSDKTSAAIQFSLSDENSEEKQLIIKAFNSLNIQFYSAIKKNLESMLVEFLNLLDENKKLNEYSQLLNTEIVFPDEIKK